MENEMKDFRDKANAIGLLTKPVDAMRNFCLECVGGGLAAGTAGSGPVYESCCGGLGRRTRGRAMMK